MNTRNYIEVLDGKLNIVGKNIQKCRENLGFSRQFFSDRLMNIGVDISAQSVYDIENGTRTVADYELAAISRVLKTTSDLLMKEFYDYIDNIQEN